MIYWTIIGTAALNGVGASILWTAQGKYISECATNKNKGRLNSYFWVFYMSSQIIGNLVGSIVLHINFSEQFLFLIFGALSIIGSLTFIFLGDPKLEPDRVSDFIKESRVLTSETWSK